MGPARIYPLRKMHRSRAPSIAPGTFFVAQPWADCITNMPGFNLRQAHRLVSVAAKASDFEIEVAGGEGITRAGDGGAGPLKPSMRWFQASHASRSASLRAAWARSAEARTEAP